MRFQITLKLFDSAAELCRVSGSIRRSLSDLQERRLKYQSRFDSWVKLSANYS